MTDDISCGTVTVRLIRSFEHRNIKPVVFQDVDLTQKTRTFMECVDNDLKTRKGIPPPFRTFKFDTMKILHQAHGSKTSDPAINTDCDEELILSPDVTLQDSGIKNETELSYFKREDYEKYKLDPTLKW
ncbi:UPF0538 protein C2orf76 homolog [Mizuhopecten yessoensis]|uniref:UPF0538 protein C2orf76-like n=1 Tax=Mizuhopecten yessoensis TaxID=6573 RepID=A0A210PVH4_MIZYE|nr:UPF0538 protein C2orf76 homolog [Mizuhopecten yessoensis]OWF40497.1 UPF0538 protein C2orf76-like [Mizuhopecten yessoensis]